MPATIVAVLLAAAGLAGFGAATDVGHRRRIGMVGLAAIPAAVTGIAASAGADLPAWLIIGSAFLAALAAAIAVPALAALLVSGVEVRSPATPRMRFVLGAGSAWSTAARTRQRVLLPVSAAIGLLTAAAAWLVSPTAPWPAAGIVLVAVASAIAVSLGYRRTVGKDRVAEATARVLLATTLSGLVGILLTALRPDTISAAALGAATVGCLIAAVVRPAVRPGRTYRPGTAGYRRATRGFERSARPRPGIAITAGTVQDVQTAIRTATASSLHVIANTTGHAASSLPDLAGTALVRVKLREPVTVNLEARTVRIPAGTAWGDVVHHIAPTGLIAPHGSSALVGAIGYLLRGGLSFYGRSSGVAANAIESIELVTADGEHCVVDRRREPELFWALRGGGGGFGVITALTVRLFPVTALTTGTVFWAADHAPALLAAWSTWHQTAPREASTTFRVMRLPPVPGIPRALTGRPVVNVDGVIHSREPGGESSVAEITAGFLDPLRRIAPTLLDTWRAGTVLDVPWTHMDPAVALPTGADHQLLTHLDATGQAALLDVALRAKSPLATIELRQLGGAFDDAPDDGGALDRMRGATSLYATGLTPTATRRSRTEAELAELRAAISPWGTGFTAPNYAEDRRRPQRTFPPDVAAQVDAIRKRYDPTGVFTTDVTVGATPPD
ncbi:FAD-binding protein [Microbacterium foliorum]|nr:FAD-binding protein [Microbacterium foliorum]